MIVPASYLSTPSLENTADHAHPASRRTASITLLLPIVILAIFLLILVITLLLARCLYRRSTAFHTSSSHNGPSWRIWDRDSANANNTNNNNNMSDDYGDGLNEEERLLARRRSTSYYDANRSRAPLSVIVGQDMKGRPISTWSTASSVAAQRGEELSQWSRRRDDLIRIYGKGGHFNSGSFVAQEDLDEEEEENEEQDEPERNNEQQHQDQYQDHGKNHDHGGAVTKSENGLGKSHDV